MTVFDYAVLAILLVSIVVSVLRGLVREILSLIGWVAAFVLANLFSSDVAALLPAVVGHPVLRLIVAFLLLLLGGALTMAIINWGILRAIAAAGLELADRGLGGLFGLARGVVIVLALVLVAGMTRAPQMDFWKDALFSSLAEAAVDTLLPFLPVEVAGKVKF
jgi:membrane protein required for colicin V production